MPDDREMKLIGKILFRIANRMAECRRLGLVPREFEDECLINGALGAYCCLLDADAWPNGIEFDMSIKRRSIPRKTRREVMERDGSACRNCGSTESLAMDHVHPWSKGGPDEAENLQVLCKSCNSSKRDRIPE